MAFDGITVAALTKETSDLLVGGRVAKISQPEADELIFTIKNNGENYKLLMSASATLPLYYLTEENKLSPMQAPGFCMLLRKHIGSGRIVSITQPDFERVICIEFEHLNEMGDLCRKKLLVELMGKHSNIIFTDDRGMILDAIKHVSSAVSSVREVLPGRDYFIPGQEEKKNPLMEDAADVKAQLTDKAMPLFKAIYTSYTGVSPIAAQEICYLSGIDSDMPFSSLKEMEQNRLVQNFAGYFANVRDGLFSPEVCYENGTVAEYSALPLSIYAGEKKKYASISELIFSFYEEKSKISRIRAKSADLRHIVSLHIERNAKKLDLQRKQYADTEKRDTYKVYGELLNTYGYSAKAGDKEIICDNYYTGEKITIPLDVNLTATENAKKYFDKYGKLKRTREALESLLAETEGELEHLQSILVALDIARGEEDLQEIREEMSECGYIKKTHGSKKNKQRVVSRPLHYVTDAGFHIYVGKNNYQNDELTFGKGGSGDMWFHAKKIPGSHVVLRAEGREIPDKEYEIAAAIAAYYSKGASQEKVEIDYTLRKNVKKPAAAKPGFVVYYTNYSMVVSPIIHGASLE